MKAAMKALNIPVLALISSCSNVGTEDTRYVGFSEARYWDVKTNKFKDRFWSPSTADCIVKDDQFDIRLQSLKMNQEFEGFWEKLTSDSGNELGVFLTVNKTKIGNHATVAQVGTATANTSTPGTVTSPIERRLVYMTDSRLKNVDINAANLPIYSDVYDGSDYKLTLEVIEFDADNMKKYASIAKEMIKAAQESGISYNPPFSSLLTNVGTALFNHVARDDKIISYETQLLGCQSIVGNERSVYLERGDLAIVRVAQDPGRIEWGPLGEKFDPAIKRLSSKSSVLLSIVRRH